MDCLSLFFAFSTLNLFSLFSLAILEITSSLSNSLASLVCELFLAASTKLSRFSFDRCFSSLVLLTRNFFSSSSSI